MIRLSRNPEKLEQRAIEYERKGKPQKAIKCREKAARLRAHQAGVLPSPASLGSTPAINPIRPSNSGVPPLRPATDILPANPSNPTLVQRTPAQYENNALKWEQRGNWPKAQKNREKVWRLRNPQYVDAPAPQFYNNNRFLGYDAPLSGAPLVPPQNPIAGQSRGLAPPILPPAGQSRGLVPPHPHQAGGLPLLNRNRDPATLEAKAAEYDRRGKPAKAQKYREKAARVRDGTYTSSRNPPFYENQARKWEQRRNWDKAQKNRAKYWRLQNPQYAQHAAPSFYNNGSFLGYDVPVSGFNQASSAPLAQAHLLPQQQHGHQTHSLPFLGRNRDPGALEARAAEYDRRGKPAKAQKYREKAARVRAGTYSSTRTPNVYENQAHKWEQRRNWDKAQKNRAKYWRLQNPQYAQSAAPSFYNNGSFLGYDVPLSGYNQASAHAPLPFTQPHIGQQPHSLPFLGRNRDPASLEAKAAEYDRRGKPAKAQKYREKAARVRAGTYSSTRTPNVYENQARKWEQRRNWDKAQKNRAKYWRLQNPQYAQSAAPSFYNNGSFLGYDVPLSGYNQASAHAPLPFTQPHIGQQTHSLPFLGRNRDPVALEAKAAEYNRRGKPAKAQKYREKAARVRAGTYSSTRTPNIYENQARKWEQRRNWDKAQKNRAKYWRLQNPQYAQSAAPSFYNNGAFLGYNVPLPGYSQASAHNPLLPQQTFAHSPIGQQTHSLPFLHRNRDPAALEARAAEFDRRGKPAKAQKYREKAARVRAGTYSSTRTPNFYENQAHKWEQRRNWDKAQKNRAKYWRLQNPQYAQSAAPSFYNNGAFLGYNVPFNPTATTSGYGQLPPYSNTTTTTIPSIYAPAGSHHPTALLPSRDPVKLEARAIENERRGKIAKAQKQRDKAARIRAGNYSSRRTPEAFEAKALRYEQAGDWRKAQKNREKVWRLHNPNFLYSTHPAPQFYNNNRFLGYNHPVPPMSTFQQQPSMFVPQTQGVTFAKTGVPFNGNNLPFNGGFPGASANTIIPPQTIYAAPIVEHIMHPTIVEETSRPERIVEIQPIIHREVEAPTIKIIEQHVYETVPAAGPSTITKTAIVQETVIPKIIEEVQPVIHREVPAPFVEHVEQHMTEHIVKPVVQTREVVNTGTTTTTTTTPAISAGAPIITQGTSFPVTGATTALPTAQTTGIPLAQQPAYTRSL